MGDIGFVLVLMAVVAGIGLLPAAVGFVYWSSRRRGNYRAKPPSEGRPGQPPPSTTLDADCVDPDEEIRKLVTSDDNGPAALDTQIVRLLDFGTSAGSGAAVRQSEAPKRAAELDTSARAAMKAAERAAAAEAAERKRRTEEAYIQKFLEIAYRRVATPDDYGDENPVALDAEIVRLLKKLSSTRPELQRLLDMPRWATRRKWTPTDVLANVERSGSSLLVRDLRARFAAYYENRKGAAVTASATALEDMRGEDFELHLADALRAAGVQNISSTPRSGDQGGDLLFSVGERRVVIQAKRWRAAVGNKAVQEAHAAKDFYGCAAAWVVTNSIFTPSARTLAKELGVLLVDGSQLADLAGFVRTQLGS